MNHHLINQMKEQAKAMAEAGSEGWSRTVLQAVHEMEVTNTIQTQQSNAWFAVCNLLNKLKPDWQETDDPNITVLELALNTIHEFKSELDQAQVVISKLVGDDVKSSPKFPTMLRKMWSGKEVQEWVNENWNKGDKS